MLTRTRVLRVTGCSLALLALAATSASAHTIKLPGGPFRPPEGPVRPPVGPIVSPIVGHAYVDDNTATANTVAGFYRHADGSLTPIPGSPFPAGGVGSGVGLASQGALQLSSDGRYLLAVDAASNQISVLTLAPNGAPYVVGAPVSSGGTDPISI